MEQKENDQPLTAGIAATEPRAGTFTAQTSTTNSAKVPAPALGPRDSGWLTTRK